MARASAAVGIAPQLRGVRGTGTAWGRTSPTPNRLRVSGADRPGSPAGDAYISPGSHSERRSRRIPPLRQFSTASTSHDAPGGAMHSPSGRSDSLVQGAGLPGVVTTRTSLIGGRADSARSQPPPLNVAAYDVEGMDSDLGAGDSPSPGASPQGPPPDEDRDLDGGAYQGALLGPDVYTCEDMKIGRLSLRFGSPELERREAGMAWVDNRPLRVLACLYLMFENFWWFTFRAHMYGLSQVTQVLVSMLTLCICFVFGVGLVAKAPRTARHFTRNWTFAVTIAAVVHLWVAVVLGPTLTCGSDGLPDLSSAPGWVHDTGSLMRRFTDPHCPSDTRYATQVSAVFWHPVVIFIRWTFAPQHLLGTAWYAPIVVVVPLLWTLAWTPASGGDLVVQPAGEALTVIAAMLIVCSIIMVAGYRAERFRRLHFVHLLRLGRQIRLQSNTYEKWLSAADRLGQQQAQEKILGYICHELRNPTFVISGFVESFLLAGQSESMPSSPAGDVDQPESLPRSQVHTPGSLSGRHAEVLPRGMRADMECVARACDRMGTILNDVLDMSRLRAGKLALAPSPNSIRSLVAESAAHARSIANVPVRWEVDRQVPETLVFDNVRVGQCLANALSNAAKLTVAGEIMVTVQRVAPQVHRQLRELGSGDPLLGPMDGDHSVVETAAAAVADRSSVSESSVDTVFLKVQIFDSGPGISAADSTLVFEEYAQVLSRANRSSADSQPGAYTGTLTGAGASRADGESVEPASYGGTSNGVRSAAGALSAQVMAGFGRGTGLGLPICRRIVSLMDGAIGLGPRPDGVSGACLWFTMKCGVAPPQPTAVRRASGAVGEGEGEGKESSGAVGATRALREVGSLRVDTDPLSPSSDGATETSVPFSAGAGAGSVTTPVSVRASANAARMAKLNLHVCVVDDELLNRKLLQRMLRMLGCTCELLEDGDELSPALARTHFDAVTLDIVMVRTNGAKVCRQLHEAAARGSLTHALPPVIAATGNVQDDDRRMYLEAGFSHILHKPFSLSKLRDALEAVTFKAASGTRSVGGGAKPPRGATLRRGPPGHVARASGGSSGGGDAKENDAGRRGSSIGLGAGSGGGVGVSSKQGPSSSGAQEGSRYVVDPGVDSDADEVLAEAEALIGDH